MVAQLALTVALLAGAGLALKSFWQVQNTPFGFRRDGILMVAATLPEARYDDDRTRMFYSELLARVRALPGVDAVATAYNVPFDVYSRPPAKVGRSRRLRRFAQIPERVRKVFPPLFPSAKSA